MSASKQYDFLSGDAIDLPSRALRKDILHKFKYHVVTQGGRPVQVANYYNPQTGALTAQKVRTTEPKDFYVIGELSKCGLFGEQLWEAGGKRLVITEGEIDAMAYASATGGNWPVVSIPTGAAGAAKSIKARLEFVESFDEVIFMFDSDKPGKEAALECAALLRPGLARIVELPLKDAGDMLVAGRTDELRKSIFQAKTYRPDGILEGSSIAIEDLMRSVPRGFEMPYPGLEQKLRGIRPSELIMICAGSGVGKSTLARELGFHLIHEHHQKVGWIMLEENYRKTADCLIAMANDIPASDLLEDPSVLPMESWIECAEYIMPKCSFYDAWGSTEVDNLISKMRYLAVGCECQFIILDHVSMVVSGLDTDERKTLDILMTKLRQFTEQTGVGVIAVSHLRRNTNKESFNEGGQVSLTDLRGSAAIEQLSDVVLAAERDQQSDTKSNLTRFRILKNRPHGVLGSAGAAVWVNETGRLVHTDEDFGVSSGNDPFEETF